ncbi:MAG: PQQ-binding-like beta-propeller repeat protein [Acidobacteriota bacterium]|nr:PQQ-binding-like beta-propeller repeat protein [Acidobacteriota bacterium]
MKAFYFFCILFFSVLVSNAQPVWQSNLDAEIQFYQTTDFGILLVGTNNSLYGIDGKTGQRLWRRSHKGLDETSITPVPGTDLILFTLDEGKKSRLEAVDVLTGNSVWRSDKVKGDVLQLAVEPAEDLIAVVMVEKPRGEFGKELRRKPVTHVLRLSDGEELWERKFVDDVELMPSRFDKEGEIAFTLDNYRPPLILDGRLFMFYEGVTSYDATNGKSREREEFGVNEDGLALTDADPVFDEKYIYISGRGKVRAVDRRTGNVVWKADDLGVTPEMAVVGNILYVRTGGQFTRIRDGEIKKHGPFGVSAIDTRNGKGLWRYKGADKGLTNFVFADEKTILIADEDDLISIDARNGKRLRKSDHGVKDAQFVLFNERNEAVVGGRDELKAFKITDLKNDDGKLNPVWMAKHKPPARGIFRVVAGIALRATALYFRYGGLATSTLNLIRGASIARSALSLRFSGLKTRFAGFDLTTIASNAGQDYTGNSIRVFGIAARNPNILNRIQGLQIIAPNSSNIRGKIIGGAVRRVTPLQSDVQESLLERLDPVRQIEKLSDYFLRRKRLAAYRGNFMYFYTDLPKPFDKKGLVGVNIHTGEDARFILVENPDARFITDEINGLLYSANGQRLLAYDVLNE